MATDGAFVNATLATSVPWSDLVQQGNLQSILLAIVRRLDRFDKTLAGAAGASAVPLAVLPEEDLKAFREKLDVLENITLQQRVESLKPLGAVASDARKKFNLSQHVIPLTQLKGKIDSFDVALQASAQQIDETNARLAALAQAFQSQFEDVQQEVKVS
jgi:hypothetical protein